MNTCWKILALSFVMSLSACSTFYSRHYTKGIFYDGIADRAQAAIHAEPPTATVVMKHVADSVQTACKQSKEKTPVKEKRHSATPENISSSARQKFISPEAASSSPFLKQALRPIQNKIQTSRSSGSVAGKAACYILALILAVGIMTLAIYFLPAILIPAAASSTFSTILLLGTIVVVGVFAFLIYTLIKTLIDLFRNKKIPEEEEF